MEFDEYQEVTGETAVYPEDKAVEFLALGLNGEAGEVAEKIKKHMRDGKDLDEELRDEIGDCLWYISRLLDELGFSMDEAAEENVGKVQDRAEREKIHGSGDNR